MNKSVFYNVFVLLIALVVGTVIVLFMSYSTSCLFEEPFTNDSAVFQIIGKYWTEGYLPYSDLFDVKGPVTFFVNALGYYITGNRMGIAILQIVCMTVNILMLNKIYRIVFSPFWSVVLTILSVLSITNLYQEGNTVEEPVLPLLLLSFYLFYRWLDKEEKNGTIHPLSYAFVYGITFGICLFSRLTNAVGVCVCVLFVAILLIRKNQWKNLLYNSFSFLGGVCVIIIPFIVYFYLKGNLDEMFFGSILFGFTYAASSGFDLFTRQGMYTVIVYFIDGYMLLFICIYLLLKGTKNRMACLAFLLVSLFTLLWLFMSNGYHHYCLICVAYFPIALVLLYKSSGIRNQIFLFIVSILFHLIITAYGTYNNVVVMNKYMEKDKLVEALRPWMSDVPSDYKDSFIAYNCTADIYLHMNIKPYYNVFTSQDKYIRMGGRMKESIIDQYSNGDVKWILIGYYRHGKTTLIDGILSERYYLYKEDPKFALYRLKE